MMLSFFDQFLSPHLLGVPLILLATLLPTLFLTPHHRLLPNRVAILSPKLAHRFIKQLLLPISRLGHNWAMPLTATMFYLLSTNLLGLLPYTFTPTTQLSMNMSLALPLWLTTVLLGLRNQPTLSIGHLLPLGTPAPLIPILITIESASLLIRPIALGIRLTANLTAGHLLIQLISVTALTLTSLLPTIAMLTYGVLLLLTLLELAVAMIQAYVFTLLLSLYLQENV